jgi:signal peptidase II
VTAPRAVARPIRLALLALILAVTVSCDQASKHIARQHLTAASPVALVCDTILLDLQENPGAFLGFGASLPGGVRAALSALAAAALVLICIHVVWAQFVGALKLLGIAMLVSGGMSNGIDRLVRGGKVTDFLLSRLGPLHTGVLNVADIAITPGAVLLVLAAVRRRAAGAW